MLNEQYIYDALVTGQFQSKLSESFPRGSGTILRMRSLLPAVCLTLLTSCAAVAVQPEPPQPSIEAVQLAGGAGNIIRLALTVKLHTRTTPILRSKLSNSTSL